MKRKLLLTAVALLCAVGTWAQTSYSTASLSAGDFYLYNVGTGKFLNRGNDFGYMVATDYSGTVVTLAGSSNSYTMYTGFLNGSGTGYINKGHNGPYTNMTSYTWTIAEVDGHSGYYTIKYADDEYLAGSGSATNCILAALEDNNYFYWQLVSKSVREDLSTASVSTPVDATFFIENQNFNLYSEEQTVWKKSDGSNWQTVSNNSNVRGGNGDNTCAEVYNNIFDIHQTKSVTNGKYRVTCQAFYRAGGAGTTTPTQNVLLYANSKEAAIMNINSGASNSSGSGYTQQVGETGKYVPNGMSDASTVFSAGAYVDNYVDALVTDGSLTIGVKKSTGITYDWAAFDNFQLTYYGNSVEAVATAGTFSSATNATSGTWYSVTTTKGYYDITASGTVTISYTQDASQDADEGSYSTWTFSGAETKRVLLNEGSLYFKTNSDKNITITYLGNDIQYYATALPGGGAMTAGQWYSFTIATAGYYDATASSDLSDIVYTTVGTTNKDNEGSITANFDETENTLLATTYYVKSTSDQTLTIEQSENVDLTSAITNPSFESGFTGWTNPSPSMQTQINDSFSKTGAQYAERWQQNVGLSNGTLTQTITLPAGIYKLTADMQNLEQPNGDIRGSGFYLRAGETLMETGTELLTTLYFTLAAASDVTIGATLSSCSGNWVAVDNFTLTYNPTLPGSLTAVTGKMKASVASTQTTAVEAYNATSGQTVANYNTAANAIADAQRSKAVYTLLGDALDTYNTKAANLDTDGQSSYASATSTIQTGYNDATLTDAEAYAAIATVKAAYLAAVIAQTSIGSDWTDVITNPSFEDEDMSSWTFDDITNTSNRREGGGGSDGSYHGAFWKENYNSASDPAPGLHQSVTLPAGYYRVEFDAYNHDGSTHTWKEVQLYFGATESDPLAYNTAYKSWRTFGFDFEVAATTTANLGVKFTPTEDGSIWEHVDNFHLTYLGSTAVDAKKVSLSEEITTANGIYNSGANVGAGAFQIPTDAADTFTAAITAAQSVYDDGSATVSDVTTAIATLKTAEETYAGATLNAPTSGVQYRIKSTAADAAAWKNLYYVLKKGGNDGQGGYSIRAEGSDAAYLATAWQFTSVSGNDYKLSMTDADGATRYICTALGGYDSGNTTQIRTTTDASKALVVKVIAATGTAGRWYLQNTEDDSYIGGQDAGFYSNSQNYDLALEAAEKASVPVTISAGKYATRIFPFKPTLPSGVTAHSCAANVGSTLTLGDVADPVANVPYILLNNSGADVDENLVGWGTAMQDTYNVGYLTGFYTAQTITAGNYVLQTQAGKQAFYKLEEDAIANQVYRAYLTVPSGVKPAAFFFDEGQADAISDVRGQMEDGRSEIFNLAGQRVNKAQKGLYIINGKKVLVK